MTTVPTKIVLKSTTRMSLNDRFSNLATPSVQTPSVQSIRANIAAEQQVSAANRRLAQQLANRPGLQGAAGDMYNTGMQQQGRMRGQQRSIQQRLGRGNIKNRLSLPAGSQPIRGRGWGRGRGFAQMTNQGGGGNFFVKQQRGRGTFVPRNIRGRGGMRGRGRGGYNYNRLTGQNTTFVRRGGRGGGGNRGFRGRGRGRGGNRGGNSGSVTQQDLDAQLDTYMAKTKSALDTELDAYMTEVTS